ncbi:hypothetical protein ACP70R_040862 [Stipagrostis hirtigluma subsp. patula]
MAARLGAAMAVALPATLLVLTAILTPAATAAEQTTIGSCTKDDSCARLAGEHKVKKILFPKWRMNLCCHAIKGLSPDCRCSVLNKIEGAGLVKLQDVTSGLPCRWIGKEDLINKCKASASASASATADADANANANSTATTNATATATTPNSP